jgi:rare lipoprotein A
MRVALLAAAISLAATTAHASVLASCYGAGEKLNRHTSTGEVFSSHAMTAAHRTLPLGTRVRVSHGSRSVIVRINDRGPALWTGKAIDLTCHGSARALGMNAPGVTRVELHVL